MNPKRIFRIGVRLDVLCLAVGACAALMCGPVAAQETSDESSSQEIVATSVVSEVAPDANTIAGASAEATDETLDEGTQDAGATGPELAATEPAIGAGSGPFSIVSPVPALAFARIAFADPSPATPAIGNSALSSDADRCDILSGSGLLACLSNVLHDQRGILTAPLHVHRSDAIWLVPLAGVTAAAFAFDNQTLAAASSRSTPVRIASDFSNFGSAYTIGGAAVGIYLIGRLTHNERARETGMVALEALADAGIVTEGIKLSTNRFRPDRGMGSGMFWPDGRSASGGETELYTINGSFPSGHTTATWAVVHVLVDETPGHRWLHVGLYALGVGVGFSRVVAREHYPSDVVVGGALGYLIGGYVYRQRSQFYEKGPLKSVSLSPIYDATTRTYGMGVSFVP